MTPERQAQIDAILEDEIRSRARTLPTFYTSLEINKPLSYPVSYLEAEGMTLRQYVEGGLGAWSRAGATNIVQVSRELLHGHPASYPLLPAGLVGGIDVADYTPGLRKNPGTWTLTDQDAWKTIASDAKLIAKQTGRDEIYLDMETASKPFHDGKATIHLPGLLEALKPLRDTGIRCIFHAVQVDRDTNSFPERMNWTQALVHTVHKALPTAVFMTLYESRRDWAEHKWLAELSKLMEAIVGRSRMWVKMYVPVGGIIVDSHGRDQRYYDGAGEAIAMMLMHMDPDATCVLYSGAADYLVVGRQAAALVNGGA